MTMNIDEKLSETNYDLERGYGCIQNLCKEANKDGVNDNLNYIKEWVRKQPIKQRRNYKNYNRSSPPYARAVFQPTLWIL